MIGPIRLVLIQAYDMNQNFVFFSLFTTFSLINNIIKHLSKNSAMASLFSLVWLFYSYNTKGLKYKFYSKTLADHNIFWDCLIIGINQDS